MVKIDLKDLELALEWIKTNSNNSSISIDAVDKVAVIKCLDKYESDVEITLFDTRGPMLPKIKKTELLRK